MVGDDATLNCSIPSPSGVIGTPDFHWEGPRVNDFATSDGTLLSQLLMNNISTSQAGVYQCTASFRVIRFSSANVVLFVQSEDAYALLNCLPLSCL